MSIELVCPQCQATLRVPDEAVGEQAKCPHCETVFEVTGDDAGIAPPPVPPVPPITPPAPEPTSDPFAETTVKNAYADPPSAATENPYAAPMSEEASQQRFQEIQLGQLDAGKSLQFAWEMFRANLATMLVANAIVIIVIVVVSGMADGLEEMGLDGPAALVHIVSYAMQWFFSIGLTLINLNIARGQPADVGLLFGGAPWFLRVTLATIIFSIAVGLGAILFLIPGIYLASRFWAYQSFIIDRNCGVMESLHLSAEYTEGNKMQSVVVMLFSVLLVVLGLIAACVGIFFTIPVFTMMWVVAYLMITRQPIQRPI